MTIISKLEYKFDMVLANNTLRNIKKIIRVYKNTIEIYTKTILICNENSAKIN